MRRINIENRVILHISSTDQFKRTDPWTKYDFQDETKGVNNIFEGQVNYNKHLKNTRSSTMLAGEIKTHY